MILLAPYWLVVAALLLIGGWFARQRIFPNDSWHLVIRANILSQLRPGGSLQQSLVPIFLLAGSIALCLTGPATPASEDESAYAHAESWLAVVDVSDSMNETDISPSRIDASRRILKHMPEAAGARALGLLLYSGDAFLAHPPTFDHEAFSNFSSALSSSLVELPGSRAQRALALAQTIIAESKVQRCRVWLLTDSGGITPVTMQIAQQLAQDGHRLDVILTALPDSTTPEPVDMKQARELAKRGGGNLWPVNALGQLESDPFEFQQLQADQQALRLRLGGYKLWSHWLILPLLPLLLWIWRRS